MQMSYENIIELSNVWKKYSMSDIFHRSLREDIMNIFSRQSDKKLKQDEFWALKNINISLKRGECIGLYGPNGAGKSTILKLIAHVTYPTLGTIKVNGSIAPLIEIGAGFHPDLTGRENIYMNGAIIGMSIKQIKEKMGDIIRFSEIENFIDMPVKKYSSGMYLRLGFSIAIHSTAEIYLIDEILSVGDEAFQNKCLNKIYELKEKKDKTLIIVSHDRKLLKQITERIIFIEKGDIVNVSS